jgi:hypothetical protein
MKRALIVLTLVTMSSQAFAAASCFVTGHGQNGWLCYCKKPRGDHRIVQQINCNNNVDPGQCNTAFRQNCESGVYSNNTRPVKASLEGVKK